jgi:hypothetical protein
MSSGPASRLIGVEPERLRPRRTPTDRDLRLVATLTSFADEFTAKVVQRRWG